VTGYERNRYVKRRTALVERTQRHADDQTAVTIKQYLTETILYDRPGLVLTNHLPLLEQGLIDSIQLLNLVTFLQQRFGVIVRAEAMLPENFATVNALVALVHRSEKVQA